MDKSRLISRIEMLTSRGEASSECAVGDLRQNLTWYFQTSTEVHPSSGGNRWTRQAENKNAASFNYKIYLVCRNLKPREVNI